MNNEIRTLPNGDFEVVPLDDPKFLEAEQKRQAALDILSEHSQEMEAAKQRFESKVEDWWNSLSEKDREWAFYSVCKRITQGELVDKGTYRYILYNVFGFGPGMYVQGMNCGFMAIHNSIVDKEDRDDYGKRMDGIS